VVARANGITMAMKSIGMVSIQARSPLVRLAIRFPT
jgi:hypothetical protein